jgi:hypothetical protein
MRRIARSSERVKDDRLQSGTEFKMALQTAQASCAFVGA